MLTPELQNEIDEKWDACWPLSQLKPIDILDLLSYLFFVKKISSEQQTNPTILQSGKKSENVPGFFLSGPNGKKEEITGDYFNDPDDSHIRALFASGNGLTELEKVYTQHPVYGSYVKGILLMHPTSKLLDTSLGIIKIIKGADSGTKEKIFDYLLSKTQYIDSTGHAYIPRYLADLMVAIINPVKEDVVLNPLTGSGNLLVSCAKYMAKNSGEKLKHVFNSYKLKGIESDETSLRIGGINLFLNGISFSEIKAFDIFVPLNSIADEGAAVILSNMIFLSGKNNMNLNSTSLRDALKKDIYYLDFILKNFREGARCAVIVPGRILFNMGNEFINVRKEITDNLKLNALISIDDQDKAEFNDAAILVFSKQSSAVTDKVWFYKLKHDGAAINGDENILWQTEDVVTHFKNGGKNVKQRRGFYVDADDIRAKNYNFRYSEYAPFEKEQISSLHVATIKPGRFPNLDTDPMNRPVSPLQPISRVSAETRIVVLPSILRVPKRWINKAAVNGHLFFVEKRKHLSRVKKNRVKKEVSIAGLIVLLIGIGYLFYLIFPPGSMASHENRISVTTKVDSISPKPINASLLHSVDSVVSSMNSYLSKDSADKKTKCYTVVSKAYFYSSPNTDNPQGKYITRLGGGILTSLKEENDFVYVNYINSKGKSTKGWLNKNDLEKAGSGGMENIPVETKNK